MLETVTQVLDHAAQRWGDRPAIRSKRGGRWITTSWREYRHQAREVARGLMRLGLGPGGGACIIGYNRPEWLIGNMGAIMTGGVPAGIYTTSSPEQCLYIARHCEARVVLVENRAQLNKLLAVRDQLPLLQALVLMEGDPEPGEEGVLSWTQLLELGADVPDAELEQRISAQQAGDLCTLIYTSGTTGPPKAVMISHRNLVWTVDTVVQHVGGFGPDDNVISYLPLSHIAEQLLSVHLPMAVGGCSWCLADLEALGDTLREVRPAVFLGVPRVWEKIQAKIVSAGAESSALQKRVAAWARGIGLAGGYAEQRGRPRPLLYGLAKRLVFQKVRRKLGLDRCRLAVTSTAPIARSTQEFFLSLGIPLCEVYGMSECTGPATLSTPWRYRVGRAGYVLPQTEIKIAEDGEVCMRGPHVFMGYYKDESATRETLDEEGWLHSGDVGELSDDGFLRITDRKKELIVTSGGKNISPQLIEGLLKSIPVISQAVVVGDGKKYISALLTLDPERVLEEARAAGITLGGAAEAARSDAFLSHLQTHLDQVNANLSQVESIKRFRVLPRELSIEEGELTPTMKLKRRVINERYAEEILALYS